MPESRFFNSSVSSSSLSPSLSWPALLPSCLASFAITDEDDESDADEEADDDGVFDAADTDAKADDDPAAADGAADLGAKEDGNDEDGDCTIDRFVLAAAVAANWARAACSARHPATAISSADGRRRTRSSSITCLRWKKADSMLRSCATMRRASASAMRIRVSCAARRGVFREKNG